MRPAAKARPRVTRCGTYMPREYMRWRDEMANAIWAQAPETHAIGAFCHKEPLAVRITWHTPTGNMRPDLDNAMGAVWDVLQSVDVIGNDGQIRRCSGSVERGPYQITVEIDSLPVTGRMGLFDRETEGLSPGAR